MDTSRISRGGRPAPASDATLPAPGRAHATCAWCRADFATIGQLLDHVDGGHVPLPAVAAA